MTILIETVHAELKSSCRDLHELANAGYGCENFL